jgi:BirA family biotin operon repressor/biotin-[acetyl-CoA-carboxylase] ligase
MIVRMARFARPAPAFPGVTQLLRLDETTSTQTLAKALAEQGAPEGTVVVARRQTAGRGRLERRWESRPGGLYASLVLRPRFAPGRLGGFGVTAAEALAAALAGHAGIETAVKPPNDVYAACDDGKPRKLCGLLCEAAGGSKTLDWLVVGMGVNVNNAVTLETATSLKKLTGRSWDVEDVLRAVLNSFWSRYARAQNPL